MSELSDPPAPRTSPVRLPLLGDAPSTGAALAGEARPVDRVRPIYAVWEVTRRCDLACHHCGTRAGHARSDELGTDECLDLVAQMAALGIKEVTLIGGEAYLRPDWLTIVAAVRKHGMFCSMTTGGRGITRERATQAVAAGLQSAAVSLDGMAATHDRQRALNGSFSAGVRALEFLREAGIPVSVNTQINAWTWRELPELLDVLIEQHAHAWQLQLTVPMGRAADRGIFAGNNVGYFGPHEELLRRYMPEQHRGSCGAGKVVLGLEANGTVKGCPSISYASHPPIARRLRRPSSEHLRRDRTSWLHSSSAPLVVVTSGVATPSARSAVLNGSRPQAPRGKEWRATPHARRWSHSA